MTFPLNGMVRFLYSEESILPVVSTTCEMLPFLTKTVSAFVTSFVHDVRELVKNTNNIKNVIEITPKLFSCCLITCFALYMFFTCHLKILK